VFSDVSLRIANGEIVCLVGPSGCGKTTLLNIIAGFIRPSGGSVELDGQPVHGPGHDRVVVFQDVHNSLFPWMTVDENVEFGLKVLGLARDERWRRAGRFLDLVGLGDQGKKFPDELSGGMKQRVQLARALVLEPMVLLMDEPFGALDAQTRRTMQSELLRIWGETRTTMLFITHDILEAVLLGDRVGVMSRGPGATLTRVLSMELGRPRSLTDPKFAECVTEIEGLLGMEAKDDQ
jgi:NitT/TauT family transport system ATP-binding protein